MLLEGELGARIAAGASAEVFEFGPERVLKLFRPELPGRRVSSQR